MTKIETFTFGPELPLDSNQNLLNYIELYFNGTFFEPPFPLSHTVKLARTSVYHGTSLTLKRNLLTSTFEDTQALSPLDFMAFVQDFLLTGNGYLQMIRNKLGAPLRLRRLPALKIRRGALPDEFFLLNDAYSTNAERLRRGSVFHLKEPDPLQDVYGVPSHLAAHHSILLNEAATIFRRRYYENGNHAGFVFYLNDPMEKDEDVKKIKEKLESSKGPGNFKNLFLYIPNGKPDGVRVIPVSEAIAKDDFASIKRITRDDEMAIHRVPPQLVGVIPQGNAGFGAADTAAGIFVRNEIEPLQALLRGVNAFFGQEVIKFAPYRIGDVVENLNP